VEVSQSQSWKKSFLFYFFSFVCTTILIDSLDLFFEANIRIFDGVLFVREVMTFYEGPIREEPCSPSPKLG
jgi:hypothetical protein